MSSIAQGPVRLAGRALSLLTARSDCRKVTARAGAVRAAGVTVFVVRVTRFSLWQRRNTGENVLGTPSILSESV